jgi:hypothetical protein
MSQRQLTGHQAAIHCRQVKIFVPIVSDSLCKFNKKKSFHIFLKNKISNPFVKKKFFMRDVQHLILESECSV